jgi:hypothetical protein
MFPIDNEFTLMYLLYGAMLAYILIGLIYSERKLYFRVNLFSYITYFILMAYVFIDPENFSGGNSLVILFYGSLLVISHFIILVLIKYIQILFEK